MIFLKEKLCCEFTNQPQKRRVGFIRLWCFIYHRTGLPCWPTIRALEQELKGVQKGLSRVSSILDIWIDMIMGRNPPNPPTQEFLGTSRQPNCLYVLCTKSWKVDLVNTVCLLGRWGLYPTNCHKHNYSLSWSHC